MTPERLQEIRDRVTRDSVDEPLEHEMWAAWVQHHMDEIQLFQYIDLLHEDLRITRGERDAEKKKRMADAKEIAALRRGQGTAPAPADPGATAFHVTHPIPDSRN